MARTAPRKFPTIDGTRNQNPRIVRENLGCRSCHLTQTGVARLWCSDGRERHFRKIPEAMLVQTGHGWEPRFARNYYGIWNMIIYEQYYLPVSCIFLPASQQECSREKQGQPTHLYQDYCCSVWVELHI